MISAPSAIIDSEALVGRGKPITVVDPSNEKIITEIPEADASMVDLAMKSARAAFERGDWRLMPVEDRQRILRSCADAIEVAAEEISVVECSNTGIPITQIRSGAAKRAAGNFRFFADYIGQMSGELYEQAPDHLTLVRREPVGVAVLISPWNAPLALGSMKVASAIAFGNSCILKPAEQAPLGLTRLIEVIQSAGLPPGVVNLVNGFGPSVGDQLIRHGETDRISFTGGTKTGRQIMAAAGQNLTPSIMELGGKSATIIFDDADFDQALDGALLGIFSNNGQQCLAGSRILVQRGIADRFIKALVERTRQISVGDPRAPETEVGPLGNRSHYRHVMGFVPDASDRGARVLVGGRRPDGFDRGFYFLPTIVEVDSNSHRLCQEEIFGPFASLIRFDDDEEAYRIANESRFGLVGYAWSRDIGRILTAQERISAGTIWCNTPMMRDLRAPFGGIRQSGVGAEGGRAAEAFYANQKSVIIARNRLDLRRLGARGERSIGDGLSSPIVRS